MARRRTTSRSRRRSAAGTPTERFLGSVAVLLLVAGGVYGLVYGLLGLTGTPAAVAYTALLTLLVAPAVYGAIRRAIGRPLRRVRAAGRALRGR